MLKQMKMSKSGSGKASRAMASKNQVASSPEPAASLGTDRLTRLSELAGLANLAPQVALPSTALPITNTNSGTSTAQHDLLLRLLSEQRNRQLLADAQAERSASLVTRNFTLAAPAEQQMDSSISLLQRLMLAQQARAAPTEHRQEESSSNDQRQRMIQDLLSANQRQQDLVNLHRQQQHQRDQQQHDAVRMAILALNNTAQQQQNKAAR